MQKTVAKRFYSTANITDAFINFLRIIFSVTKRLILYFRFMKLRELKQKRWFRILSNKYLLLLLVFGVWMLFFDSNSWLVHRELNQEIDKLKNSTGYYQKEIQEDSALINQLNNAEGLERYAREKYFMKRNREEVYIIEFQDSLQGE